MTKGDFKIGDVAVLNKKGEDACGAEFRAGTRGVIVKGNDESIYHDWRPEGSRYSLLLDADEIVHVDEVIERGDFVQVEGWSKSFDGYGTVTRVVQRAHDLTYSVKFLDTNRESDFTEGAFPEEYVKRVAPTERLLVDTLEGFDLGDRVRTFAGEGAVVGFSRIGHNFCAEVKVDSYSWPSSCLVDPTEDRKGAGTFSFDHLHKIEPVIEEVPDYDAWAASQDEDDDDLTGLVVEDWRVARALPLGTIVKPRFGETLLVKEEGGWFTWSGYPALERTNFVRFCLRNRGLVVVGAA